MYADRNPNSHVNPEDAVQRESVTNMLRHDQYVHYTHEMTYDTGEMSARVLIRTVPLIYGALLGGLIGDIVLGMVFGLMLTAGLDMRMGKHSLFRPALRPLMDAVCPILSMRARPLRGAMAWFHLPVPSFLRSPGCGGS